MFKKDNGYRWFSFFFFVNWHFAKLFIDNKKLLYVQVHLKKIEYHEKSIFSWNLFQKVNLSYILVYIVTKILTFFTIFKFFEMHLYCTCPLVLTLKKFLDKINYKNTVMLWNIIAMFYIKYI